jgi:uncharacterized protein (TIGR03118 family)
MQFQDQRHEHGREYEIVLAQALFPMMNKQGRYPMNTRQSVQQVFIVIAALFTLALASCSGGGNNHNNNMNSQQPVLTLAVDPSTIALGQSATVTWNSSTGSSCTASGAWSGNMAASGSTAETPTAAGTLTYTLACAGSGTYSGSVTKSATLEVTAPTAYAITRLVGDTAAAGPVSVDPNLVNPWGIAFGPTSPAWVANNHSGTSTLYNGNGNVLPLVVSLPQIGGDDFGSTGVVFNNTGDFVVTSGAASAPANFIFAGESGSLVAWSATVDQKNAVMVYTAADSAEYKGLTMANNGSGNFLYATDFRNGKVDVFDKMFTKQTTSDSSFAFKDPNLPAGYGPFGIQALPTGPSGATQIYVAYAQVDTSSFDEVPGAGVGLVDVYDTNGNFIKQLIPKGVQLNAPWGMALAPADFGTLSNALLVGNFGDGKINGYNVNTGAFIAVIADSSGAVFQVPGLWGIAFGNDAMNQPKDTLFYAAGTNDEANGEYGRVDLGATPPVLGAPPTVAITSPAAGTISGMVTVTASVADPIAIAKVELFANGKSLGVFTTAPYSVAWDTSTVANDTYSLTAVASDVNRNVATSASISVKVDNSSGPAATTLTQLQTSIFTPTCSVCHTGTPSATANGLPGVMNLSAGNSFAALVSVTSLEQPGMQRVAPGDATNSYVIHKLEGAADIVGSRMPLGGPFLDQATIDQVKSWINAGALNN